ncbi:MAG: TonB-dependent receptor [Gemmatimonadaceae bacterium]
MRHVALWHVAVAFVLLATSLVASTIVAAQPAVRAIARLSGYVRDKANNELVRYALISVDGDSVRSQSDVDGFYFLILDTGVHRLQVRALGFAPLDTQVTLTDATTRDLFLVRNAQLARINISATREKSEIDPASPDMSVSRLNLDVVKQAPAVLGEVDPLRSITLLPGVSRSSDASTAFSVRGGTNDQNLILLDGATIYNPAHILGFLSVFNADAVADMTLYKGALPPRFGSRLSSVLDVRQREGNANEFSGSASLGLLSSRALFEGPLPQRKGSFLVAGRRSYADLFLKFSSDTLLQQARAFFYDLNAKATYPVGKNGTLMASAYHGRDLFSPSTDFEAGWGNTAGTLRWDQIVSARLFSRVSYTATNYDFKLGFSLDGGKVTGGSRIGSRELRVEETFHVAERNTLEFGAAVGDQTVRPGDLVSTDTTSARPIHVTPKDGLTAALYVNHSLDITPRFTVQYGVRYAAFSRRGPATIFQYAANAPVVWNSALQRYEPGVLRDSTYYEGGNIKTFGGFEPRLSVRFGLNDQSSIKASYARTRQYLLLATRTNSPTPLDVWEPVGPYVKPQSADQGAIGYTSLLKNGQYEFSVETYYKRSYNLLDFVDGTDALLNPRVETGILQGVGRAYGLEVFLRKQSGPVTGWVSYTLSRAEQRYSAGDKIGINNGAWFPSPTDKLHNLSVIAIKPIWTRWVVGSTFSLATGLPVTYPVSRYVIDGNVVAEFGVRNAERLPLYHRLDMSLTRKGNRGELQFGVFNAYNHFNAQSIAFRQVSQNSLQTEAVQLSIFGVVPSISYSFKF